MIIQADKGRHTVDMNKTDYKAKAVSLLSYGPYKVLSQDPTLSLERKVAKYLLQLKHRNLLSSKLYHKLWLSGSLCPYFMGCLRFTKKKYHFVQLSQPPI